uniref:PiggyBac transposable element-derived protein 2 n=1 Tax=Sipha flava TaxID=143950 RepID=A0A2S2R5V8_9HEMI
MVKFTGRNSNKQYMPKKTIKRGFKIWCLVDKQGYLWNFEIYTGKVVERAEKQLSARLVKQLSQPLQEKNHYLFFDNYFTNYPLMTYLKSKNINACGTVNLTRTFLPALKNDKHLTLGEYDWSIDEKSTSIVKWRNKRIVSLLSNFHNPTETRQVQRLCKDGSTTMVSCPIVLSKYNKHTRMNCVDKFDQNKKSCQIDRKAKKWWHRLFFNFIDAAVVNSYVLYKLQSGMNITMKNFRREISNNLVSKTLV